MLILACITSGSFSQTLFTYGNIPVSRDEFLRAYNKNKPTDTDKEKALREYLDLYIKFKLKVKAAKDLRIDTLASIANDLQNFRTQIEESYLNDESRVNALTDEAFKRSQKDIHVAYLFFPAKEYADSAAVINAYKQSNQKWTDVGFITAFNLSYDFENIVYALKPGEAGKPFKTKTGYYIFKNIQERKAVGKMKAAQILISVPEDAKEEDKRNAKKIADSVYKALLAGADFGEAAKNISNDQLTYMTGGIMAEFGVGKYNPDFENRVFALSKDGDITQPFQTGFGYHIVKRISLTGVPQDKNDAYLYTLKQQVLQDSRITSAKEKFLSDILKKLNYKKNTAVKESDLWKVTDSFIIRGKKIALPALNANTVLFSINGKTQKVSNWFAFIKDHKASGETHEESNAELMNKFIAAVAVQNYRKRLPDLNPEFKYQLQEFKDGNMLFEVMERNIWNKASEDTAGLKKYYAQHKTKYTWGESADAVLISCSNEKTANDVAQQIKKGKSWKRVAEENLSQLQTDSGRYELAQIPAIPNTKFTEGMVTDPLINENDGTSMLVIILKMYPASQQRSFEEARGLVINDYQSFLEEKWIEKLKLKYPVKINEKAFQSLL